MTRVAVLKGGRSLERQVSLASGACVEDALERLGHEIVAIDVTSDLVARLREARPDVAFIALHGRGGEDGTVQELLEVLEIPYTGSSVHACMRCADKVLAKHALRDGGLPTPDWVSLGEVAFQELGAAEALESVTERLGFPLVVKPVSQGSALGVKFAHNAAELPAALIAARSYGKRILLERHVQGRELAVSMICGEHGAQCRGAADRRGGPPWPGVRLRGALRDRPDRLRLPRASSSRTWPSACARSRWRRGICSGRRGFARADMILGEDGPTVLEVNAIPGLTETSLLPQAADAAGMGFDEVVARVLAEALGRARSPVA